MSLPPPVPASGLRPCSAYRPGPEMRRRRQSKNRNKAFDRGRGGAYTPPPQRDGEPETVGTRCTALRPPDGRRVGPDELSAVASAD